MHPFQGHERDEPLSLLPHHVGCISVVGMQAQPPFTTNGTLDVLNGERVEAVSMPRAIPDIDSELSLRLSLIM
jgi:hypothetical protein